MLMPSSDSKLVRAWGTLAVALVPGLLVALTPMPARASKAAAPAAARASLAPEALKRALARRPLATLDGRAVSWDALQGEVIVVSFWATWCKPCQKELPRLDRLHRELAAAGGRVLAISIDLDRENVRRFVAAHALALPICLDGPDGLVRELELTHFPYTVVFDRRGAVAFATSGSDDAQLDELVAVARNLASTPRAALSAKVAP